MTGKASEALKSHEGSVLKNLPTSQLLNLSTSQPLNFSTSQHLNLSTFKHLDNVKLLALLQQGIPLCRRPFEALADEVGCEEADVIGFLDDCRAQGLVRRFGAVFDTRRLGYRSALCAAAIPPSELDDIAARLTPLSGVTHCYERVEHTRHQTPSTKHQAPSTKHQAPNLWFTLSYPADIFAAMADEVAARLRPHEVHVLPATRRYKVDVVFGAATRARDESVEDDMPPITSSDRAIIRALQGDTEIRPDYFAALAAKLGMNEWDLRPSSA